MSGYLQRKAEEEEELQKKFTYQCEETGRVRNQLSQEIDRVKVLRGIINSVEEWSKTTLLIGRKIKSIDVLEFDELIK